MTAVALDIDTAPLRAAIARFEGLRAHDPALLDILGAVAEGGARRRIQDEKRGPDGAAWAPWSARHAATRRTGQSLLRQQGDLGDALYFERRGGGVEVGSALVYAAIHQLSGAGTKRPNIPARPYLGVSDQDEQDLADAVETFWTRSLGGVA